MNITDKSMLMNSSSDLSKLRRFPKKHQKVSGKNKELMDACKDFETLFVKQMLDSMRKTVNKADKSEDKRR